MKVVYVADFVAHYNVNLHKTLEKKFRKYGDEYYLISIKNPPKVGRTGVEGKVIGNHYFYDKDYKIYIGSYRFYWQKNLLSTLNDINPDKIIIGGHLGNITAWIVTRKYKNKVYSWMCGYEYVSSRIKTFLQKHNLKAYHHHFAYSTFAKKYIKKHKVSSDKITVFHNTIDQSTLKVATSEEAKGYISEKHNINITPDKHILLYVGTLLEEKNVDRLIDMMNYLDESYILFIVGDGSYRKNLESMAKKKSNIIFTGSLVEDKHYYFTIADIFLMPGTGGLALNEALFYGNIILSALGDGSAEDLVIEGFNGMRIDNKYGKELALIVNNMYHQGTINEYKKNANQIKSRFSFDEMTDTIVKTIKDT